MIMKFKIPSFLSLAGLCASAALYAQEPATPTPKPTPAPAADPAKPAAEPAAEPEKEPLDPKVMKTNSSYGFGYRSGVQFSRNTSRFGLEDQDIDREAFIKGFFEAFMSKDPSVSEEDINDALQALGESLQAREVAVAAANLEAGKKFLEENKTREGVIATESGLQYEVLKKGEGAVYQAAGPGAPPANKQFMVHYRGTLTDGTEFDASPEGETVPMTLGVIPGFKEALTTMPVGSKWKLFIPSELAYGEQRQGPIIQANSVLIFELELVNIQDAPAPAPRPGFQLPPGTGQVPPTGQRPPTGKRPTAVSPPVRVPIQPKPEGDKPKAGEDK